MTEPMPLPAPDASATNDFPVPPEQPTDEAGPFGYFGLTLYQLFAEGERITHATIACRTALKQALNPNVAEATSAELAELAELAERSAAIREAIPRKVARWRLKMGSYFVEAGKLQEAARRLREFWKIDELERLAQSCESEIDRMHRQLQWLCEEFGWQEIEIDDTSKLVIKTHHDPKVKWTVTPGPTQYRALGEDYIKRTKPSYAFIAKSIKPLIIANEAARAAGEELPHPDFDGLATLEYTRKMKFDVKTTRNK